MISSKKRRLAALIAMALIELALISEATARQPRRPRHDRGEEAAKAPDKATDSLATLKPTGPLQIVVSIGAQRLSVYDGEKLVATTMISTGTGGHPTPTGVFAILDKEASHHSNIYGGASMPFMQRLTMSGVALHSGMVTGRPASHGCVRLPHRFAMQLFKITTLGTRVTIVRGEPVPAVLEHVRLPVPPAIQPPAIQPPGIQLPAIQPASEGAREPAPETARPVAAEVGASEVVASEVVASGVAGKAASAPAADATPPITGRGAGPRSPRKGQATLEREAALAAIPVSVFVSRQEGKVFVRRGFKPLFDAPVMFNAEPRPLGTHVFTAIEAKANGAAFKWVAVSSPSHTQPQSRLAAEPRRRGRKNEPAVAPVENYAGEPLTAAEALDRVEIPKATADRIGALLALGATLIVSDLGPSREMRENGTDFVILTR